MISAVVLPFRLPRLRAHKGSCATLPDSRQPPDRKPEPQATLRGSLRLFADLNCFVPLAKSLVPERTAASSRDDAHATAAASRCREIKPSATPILRRRAVALARSRAHACALACQAAATDDWHAVRRAAAIAHRHRLRPVMAAHRANASPTTVGRPVNSPAPVGPKHARPRAVPRPPRRSRAVQRSPMLPSTSGVAGGGVFLGGVSDPPGRNYTGTPATLRHLPWPGGFGDDELFGAASTSPIRSRALCSALWSRWITAVRRRSVADSAESSRRHPRTLEHGHEPIRAEPGRVI